MGRMRKESLKTKTSLPTGLRNLSSASAAPSQIRRRGKPLQATSQPCEIICLSDSDEEDRQQNKYSLASRGPLVGDSASLAPASTKPTAFFDLQNLLRPPRVQEDSKSGGCSPPQVLSSSPCLSQRTAQECQASSAGLMASECGLRKQQWRTASETGARQTSEGTPMQGRGSHSRTSNEACDQSVSIDRETSIARSKDFSAVSHLEPEQRSGIRSPHVSGGSHGSPSANREISEKAKRGSCGPMEERTKSPESTRSIRTPENSSVSSMKATEEEQEEDEFEPLYQYGRQQHAPPKPVPVSLTALCDSGDDDDDEEKLEDLWLLDGIKKRNKRTSQKRPNQSIPGAGTTSPRKKPEVPNPGTNPTPALPSPPKLAIGVNHQQAQADILERRRRRGEAARSLTLEATEVVLKRIEAEAAAAALAAEKTAAAVRSSHQGPACSASWATAETRPEPANSAGAAESAGAAAEAVQGAQGKVKLKLRTQDDKELCYKLARGDRFEKLFTAFAKTAGGSYKDYRFLFDGDCIKPESTPGDLDMEDDDMIEVLAAPAKA